MNWEEQLASIVKQARHVPSFQEWLRTTGYAELPDNVTSPLQMQSIMRTLYLRYRQEYGIAA